MAQRQKSCIKDTTHFINFVERTKIHRDTILVSMDVTSLCTNIPQEEGIRTVCRAYDKKLSSLARWTNWCLACFDSIGRKRHRCNVSILLAWFCFGEWVFVSISAMKDVCKCNCHFSTHGSTLSLNQFHPSIKFTAKITFHDTILYKGDRFQTDPILDIKTHYKPTETFQYTHFTSFHPSGLKRGFVKGKVTRILRPNSWRVPLKLQTTPQRVVRKTRIAKSE